MVLSLETLNDIASDIADAAAIKISKHTELDDFLLEKVKKAVLSEVMIAFSGFTEK